MANKNKTLVVVESPGKVKKIQEYLGNDYIVCASYGHIRDLDSGGSKNNLGINVQNKFEPKYKLLDDKIDRVGAIINLSQKTNKIYLATDPDREGEAIAWHLAYCLESSGQEIKRVKFNEITKSAIKKAVQNPTDLDINLIDAQQSRRVIDRIVGYLASDYLKSFGNNLSAGRVQSIAAKLIIQRDIDIETFKAEEFWNLSLSLNKDSLDFHAKYTGKISNEDQVNKIKTDLTNKYLTVSDITSDKKEKYPNPPFTTSSLQQFASSKLNMKVADVMRVAQSLYEAGLITYMRTDSTRSSPESIQSVRDYLSNNGFGVPIKPNEFSTSGAAQDAHEAIRPTDLKNKPESVFLNETEQRLYKVIWDRFIQSQMEPAVYDTVSVTFKTKVNHEFKSTGKVLVSKGWLSYLNEQGDDKDVSLPQLSIGDKFLPEDYIAEQKFTQPPSRFTEASLIKELERRGIGRPSTYASITEIVKQRGYVTMSGKVYCSTDLGKKIISKLDNNFSFMNFNYTAEMEKKLDLVAEGKLSYYDVINDFFVPFRRECKQARYEEVKDYGINCPLCNSRMMLNHGKFGFFMMCIDKPFCSGTMRVDVVDGIPIIKEHEPRDLIPGEECPICKSGMYLVQGKFGPFLACEDKPNCLGKKKVYINKKCPSCKENQIIIFVNKKPHYGCKGYPECSYIEPYDGSVDVFFNPNELDKPIKKSGKVEKILRVSNKERELLNE